MYLVAHKGRHFGMQRMARTNNIQLIHITFVQKYLGLTRTVFILCVCIHCACAYTVRVHTLCVCIQFWPSLHKPSASTQDRRTCSTQDRRKALKTEGLVGLVGLVSLKTDGKYSRQKDLKHSRQDLHRLNTHL